MPYRNIEHADIHLPKRDMTVASSAMEFHLTNGTTSHLAIPCFYVEILPPTLAQEHCRDWHDHIGWPSPRHPDHTCQIAGHGDVLVEPYLDPQRIFPIHLLDEGYETCHIIVRDHSLSGFEVDAYIDEDEDWIIRIDVSLDMQSAATTTKELPFSLFAEGYRDGREIRDIVQRGKFVILPALVDIGVMNG